MWPEGFSVCPLKVTLSVLSIDGAGIPSVAPPPVPVVELAEEPGGCISKALVV